jgi:hypothetical protein
VAAHSADPDNRETTGIGDPDLGRLGGQPRLVQIQPRVAQLGRMQLNAI